MGDEPTKLTYGHGFLSLAQAWLPVLTVVGGAMWGLYTYLSNAQEAAKTLAASEQNQAVERKIQSERESRTRLIEAQKPFLDKQLGLYLETAQVVGRLVAEPILFGTDKGLSDWEKDRIRFEELYWSELTMVEHTEVASAMVEFRTALLSVAENRWKVAMSLPSDKLEEIDEKLAEINRNELSSSALGLAHALRQGIEESWGNSADSNTIVAPYQK
jgi:hypothetical protein